MSAVTPASDLTLKWETLRELIPDDHKLERGRAITMLDADDLPQNDNAELPSQGAWKGALDTGPFVLLALCWYCVPLYTDYVKICLQYRCGKVTMYRVRKVAPTFPIKMTEEDMDDIIALVSGKEVKRFDGSHEYRYSFIP